MQPGDHVYMWCTLYQHHGIVLATSTSLTTSIKPSILIAEFTNQALETNTNFLQSTSTASGAASTGVLGGFRIVEDDNPGQWHLVKYMANPLECVSWRPGTCSAAEPSPPTTILTRVQFLRDCRHLIPDYHILASNCETVAVWCVTGKWETLQGDRAMQVSQLGALTSMAFLPVVGTGIGVAAGGLAMWHSRHIGKKWEETAQRLNQEFEWYNMGKTPEFYFQPTSS